MDDLDGLVLIRREENSLVPWQNGKGLTRQIAVFPNDANLNDFVWRISIAEIKGDSVYSQFAHIHRTQLLLSGYGVELTLPHEVHVLNKLYQSIEFSGDFAVSYHTLFGPCQVLNIMTRQDVEKSNVVVIHGVCNKTLDFKAHIFYVAQGEYEVVMPAGNHTTLRTGDAMLVTANQFKLKSAAGANAVIIEITLPPLSTCCNDKK